MILNLQKHEKIWSESPLRFVVVKSTGRISSPNCSKTLALPFLHNQTSYRRFKDSFELVGIRATDFTSSITPWNVVFAVQIAFEERLFCRSYRSVWPPNGASEAESPEVNVVEHVNRSQHAKIFWVQILSFWFIVIFVLRSHLPSNRASQGWTEHRYELNGPLTTSFRKGISPGNDFFLTRSP
jgi:hypothetical protein